MYLGVICIVVCIQVDVNERFEVSPVFVYTTTQEEEKEEEEGEVVE